MDIDDARQHQKIACVEMKISRAAAVQRLGRSACNRNLCIDQLLAVEHAAVRDSDGLHF